MFYLLLARGYEEAEAVITVDYLRRAGIEVQTVNCETDELMKGAHGIDIAADLTLAELLQKDLGEGLIFAGGVGNAERMSAKTEVLDLIRRYRAADRYLCAICASPTVLGAAGVMQGVEGCAYPGFDAKVEGMKIQQGPAHRDNKIITACGPATTPAYACAIIRAVKGEAAVEALREQTLEARYVQWI